MKIYADQTAGVPYHHSLVVADIGSLNYLIQIGDIDVLPVLHGRVLIPEAVLAELSHPGSPP